MKFEDKLKALRNNKKITQDELAAKLYVTRTAVSKWESGKGYPSIDTLKHLADFYEVSIDELISNDEILTLSNENIKQNNNKLISLITSLLDIITILYMFLPIFGDKKGTEFVSISMFNLTCEKLVLVLYCILIILTFINGVALLIISRFDNKYQKILCVSSLVLNVCLIGLFMLTKQPYPGILALVFLVIKTIIVLKRAI